MMQMKSRPASRRWLGPARQLVVLGVSAGLLVVCPTGNADRPTELALTSDSVVLAGDEFDGPAGAAPDPGKWGYDVGGGGWGNDEQQIYTDSRENSYLDGLGNLVISARNDGGAVTSARVVTRGKLDFGYGLVEARIKFPAGQGLHPAFWMLGTNIGDVGWPRSGEIDGMELVNSGTEFHNAIHGPLHFPGEVSWKQSSDGPARSDLSTEFHTYGIYRRPGSITITIDRQIVGTYDRSSLQPNERWVFDDPMYLNLNIAVGGKWPGPHDLGTPFPASMIVDWVRYSS